MSDYDRGDDDEDDDKKGRSYRHSCNIDSSDIDTLNGSIGSIQNRLSSIENIQATMSNDINQLSNDISDCQCSDEINDLAEAQRSVVRGMNTSHVITTKTETKTDWFAIGIASMVAMVMGVYIGGRRVRQTKTQSN